MNACSRAATPAQVPMEPRCLSTAVWKGPVGMVLGAHIYPASFARPLPAGDASPAALQAAAAAVEAAFEIEARAAAVALLCPTYARSVSALCARRACASLVPALVLRALPNDT